MANEFATLNLTVLPVTTLVVEGKEYSLTIDCQAIEKVQAKLGISLVKPSDWMPLTLPQLQVIAWAGLDRCHPDITLEEVGRWFGPPSHRALLYTLLENAWPGIVAKMVEVAEAQEKAKATGESQPSLPQAQGNRSKKRRKP